MKCYITGNDISPEREEILREMGIPDEQMTSVEGQKDLERRGLFRKRKAVAVEANHTFLICDDVGGTLDSGNEPKLEM